MKISIYFRQNKFQMNFLSHTKNIQGGQIKNISCNMLSLKIVVRFVITQLVFTIEMIEYNHSYDFKTFSMGKGHDLFQKEIKFAISNCVFLQCIVFFVNGVCTMTHFNNIVLLHTMWWYWSNLVLLLFTYIQHIRPFDTRNLESFFDLKMFLIKQQSSELEHSFTYRLLLWLFNTAAQNFSNWYFFILYNIC